LLSGDGVVEARPKNRRKQLRTFTKEERGGDRVLSGRDPDGSLRREGEGVTRWLAGKTAQTLRRLAASHTLKRRDERSSRRQVVVGGRPSE